MQPFVSKKLWPLTVTAVDLRPVGQRRELGGGREHLLRRALEEATAAAHEERIACEERAVLFAAARHEVRCMAIGMCRRVHAGNLDAAERQHIAVSNLARHRLHVLATDDLDVGHEILELLVASRMIKMVVGRQHKLDRRTSILSRLQDLLRLDGVDDGGLLRGIVDHQVHVVVRQRLERGDAEPGHECFDIICPRRSTFTAFRPGRNKTKSAPRPA